MQRYDRERERAQRGRDDHYASAPRGSSRNEERWPSQETERGWRDDDGMRANHAGPSDWRDSYTGYDEDEGYRSDFAQQRYGRDQDEQRHSLRANQAGPRAEGGRPYYRNEMRSGPIAPTPQRTFYSGRQYGYGPEPAYGRDAEPAYAGRYAEHRYGRDAFRDYDDSGQGYAGGYGSDLGYGQRSARDAVSRHSGYDDQRAYGERPHWAQQPSSSGRFDIGRDGDYGRAYAGSDHGTQNLRGRGPKNYTRSDERIREDISERLSDDPAIDAGDINVDVKNGVVTLSGSVDARHLKHHAEDLACHCGGVNDVDNKLTVRKAGTGQNLAGSSGGGSTSAGSRASDESGKKH